MSGVIRTLGAMPVDRFVARIWQKRPYLFRQALGAFSSPVNGARLSALATREDVESRLVTRFDGDWQVHYGPFTPRALPSDRRPDWTLLVQGVDQHEPVIAQLAQRFRFLPAARFDDVMISYAAPGGGVGPHIDQYDVFLIQAQGRRRWRIASKPDPALVEGLPLRILANFRHEQEWVLEPGDILYLPPGVAHDGTSLDHGITISVGYRLPRMQELIDTHADIQARDRPAENRLPDHARTIARQAARLPETLIDATFDGLRRAQPTRRDAQRALLENLTEPKAIVCFDPPAAPVTRARFRQQVERSGLALDLKTRMLYAGDGSRMDLAINGECHGLAGLLAPDRVDDHDRSLLRQLADHRWLKPGLKPPSAALLSLLYAWYLDGWVQAGMARQAQD